MDFFKKTYGESTVLERAQKHAKKDHLLKQVIEVVYFDPYISDASIAQAVSTATNVITEDQIKTRYKPQALRWIDFERARNTPAPSANSNAAPEPEPVKLDDPTIDDLEKQAVRIVMNAHSGITLNARMKKVVIFIFKTFAPFLVLLLTIPESYWVFTHIYSGAFAEDKVLPILTGVFAVLVDFGYLYLTVLLELNKEAMFKRRRSGQEVEAHERRAVYVQSVLWWIVASMDILAQFLFLYSATHGSTFFDQRMIMALVCVRIFSLFITMFVVSFAGTELMTDSDIVANEQIEKADKVSRVLSALGVARQKQMEAKQKLENMIADQDLRRAGEDFMKDMYADARNEAKRLREAMKAQTASKKP